jgi:3-phenylpropionate/trans-cinnamate dioxygenase ferredoxin reductase subunit
MAIVGAGEVEARAAVGLREHGFSGAISLLGEEAHLPYERPPLSKRLLIEDESSILTQLGLEPATQRYDSRTLMWAEDGACPANRDSEFLALVRINADTDAVEVVGRARQYEVHPLHDAFGQNVFSIGLEQ